MMKDAKTWVNFIHSLYMYEQYILTSRAWEEYMQKEELAAVRKALNDQTTKRPNGQLSRADIERIKRARRLEIVQSDMQPPKIGEFDFFIARDTKDAEAQVVAVGHYNPDTQAMEMATWEEVRALMQSNE